MGNTDYIVDAALVLIIFRQLRPRELGPRSTVPPIVIMVWAGVRYLRGVKTGGHDVELIVLLTAIGITLGSLSGLPTKLWRAESGQVLVRAGAVAVATWVLGMGFRFAFALYANSAGGDRAIGRFS